MELKAVSVELDYKVTVETMKSVYHVTRFKENIGLSLSHLNVRKEP